LKEVNEAFGGEPKGPVASREPSAADLGRRRSGAPNRCQRCGRFLSANEAAIEKYGYTRDEFLEMSVTDISADDDVRALLDEIASANAPRRPSFVCQHRLKDGMVIDVEMSMHLLGLDGQHRIMVSAHDVTQSRAEELKREETATYLRALIENCPLAIAVHDTGGHVVMCNPAFEALFQYRQADVVGLPWTR